MLGNMCLLHVGGVYQRYQTNLEGLNYPMQKIRHLAVVQAEVRRTLEHHYDLFFLKNILLILYNHVLLLH